jgi:hypothetical protein
MQVISLVAENQLAFQGLYAMEWVCNENLKKWHVILTSKIHYSKVIKL